MRVHSGVAALTPEMQGTGAASQIRTACVAAEGFANPDIARSAGTVLMWPDGCRCGYPSLLMRTSRLNVSSSNSTLVWVVRLRRYVYDSPTVLIPAGHLGKHVAFQDINDFSQTML